MRKWVDLFRVLSSRWSETNSVNVKWIALLITLTLFSKRWRWYQQSVWPLCADCEDNIPVGDLGGAQPSPHLCPISFFIFMHFLGKNKAKLLIGCRSLDPSGKSATVFITVWIQFCYRLNLFGVVFSTGITVSESDPEILNNSPRTCSLQVGQNKAKRSGD